MLHADRRMDKHDISLQILFERAKITGQKVVNDLSSYALIFNFNVTPNGRWNCSVREGMDPLVLSIRTGCSASRSDPTPSTSESKVALHMALSGLEGRSGTFEKRKLPAYARNSTTDRLNPLLRVISTELSWLYYEEFISIPYCTTDNRKLIQLQQNSLANFIFPHPLIHLQH